MYDDVKADLLRERDEARAEVAPLRAVLEQQVLQHPPPWHIESDWTEEVRASDGYCIAKCQTVEEATAIITLADALTGERGPDA